MIKHLMHGRFLAGAYSEAGKMAHARAAYDRALELNPRNSWLASCRIRLR